jgi:PST family polysaccharide transporter
VSTAASGVAFRGALRWALAMSWGERALGSVFTFVLAALLGPHDFGVIAMALVYIALAHAFLEQGLATALIQRDELEPEHLDAAFWMNLLWCVALAAITVVVSGWWADVNDAPALRDVLSVLSLMLVLEGLIIVQEALLQRNADFKRIAVAANVAALTGGILGVALAVTGAGVWALVAQQLAASAVALVLIWALGSWTPRLRFSRRHALELLRFSFPVFLANVGGFFNRRSDTLLVGVVFGPVVVGIYRLADRFVDFLLELTTRPMGMVALPMFSRVRREREDLRRAAESWLRLTLLVSVPALLLLAACSDFLLAVFGDEWAPGGDALTLLALAGVGKTIMSFTGPLLFAVGRPALRAAMLWLLGAASAGTVVAVAAALENEDAERQLAGVSASRALLFLLVFVPVNVAVVRAVSGVGILAFLSLARVPAAAGAAAAAVVLAVREATSIETVAPAAGLVLATLPAVAVAAGVLLALDPAARAQLRGLVPSSPRS